MFMVNVAKYTIHGSYGECNRIAVFLWTVLRSLIVEHILTTRSTKEYTLSTTGKNPDSYRSCEENLHPPPPATRLGKTHFTLPETNMPPENWLGDYFPLGFGLFSGAMLVLGRVRVTAY